MKPLRDTVANPSGFNSLANYSGSLPEASWLCLMTRTRDSDLLTESNWDSALAELKGESEAVQIFRFGHWACGWWEALAVKEGSPQQAAAEEIESSLEAYPVLDDEDFSEREFNEANRVWKECYSPKERIAYIRDHSQQFEFHGFSDLLGCVRGQYFSGYASELIS